MKKECKGANIEHILSMSKNIEKQAHRDVSSHTGSDQDASSSRTHQGGAIGPSRADTYGPDHRVNVRDRYDVIIRPSSPPFVTVIPAGQAITQPSVPHAAGSIRGSQAPQRNTITAPPSNLATESDPLPEQMATPVSQPSTYREEIRADRIYSPVARALTKENRSEDHADTVARALELLPVGENTARKDNLGSLSVKTTAQAKAVIAGTHRLRSNSEENTIIALSQQRLDRLWDGGKGHVPFREFALALQRCSGIALHWADVNGRVRTLRPLFRRPFTRTIRDTDHGSSSAELKRGLIRFKQGERGYVKVDAASALAVSRLMANDFHNFSRIIAACPTVISVLLDQKKIGHGPIFTDETIWILIANAVPRMSAYGGQTTQALQCLTSAFENYLTFHNPSNLQGPYVEPIKWAYQDSGQQADALANSYADFTRCVERIWDRLCPEKNPIRDILDRVPAADSLDCNIAAIALNIIFSGVDSHLSQVLERRKAYNKAIQSIVTIGGALPIDALKGAAGGVDGGMAGSAIGAICELLLTQTVNEIGAINERNNFASMKDLFLKLYSAVKENASKGRFVPGQRVLTQAQLEALSPDAARGPIYEDDMTSPEGNRSSIRRAFQEQYTGSDAIPNDEEYKKIRDKRKKIGTELMELIDNIDQHNPLTRS